MNGKTIFIEEFSTVLDKWMTKIYQVFVKLDNTIYNFGEPNHFEQVEMESQIQFNDMDSKTVGEMCPKSRRSHVSKFFSIRKDDS